MSFAICASTVVVLAFGLSSSLSSAVRVLSACFFPGVLFFFFFFLPELFFFFSPPSLCALFVVRVLCLFPSQHFILSPDKLAWARTSDKSQWHPTRTTPRPSAPRPRVPQRPRRPQSRSTTTMQHSRVREARRLQRQHDQQRQQQQQKQQRQQSLKVQRRRRERRRRSGECDCCGRRGCGTGSGR